MDKTENMIKYSKNKTIITQQKAIDAINEMVKNGEISLEEYEKEFEAWFEDMYDKKYSKVSKFVSENNLVRI